MPYAVRTKVDSSKTRLEIEKLLNKAGATTIGVLTQATKAVVVFETHDRRLRFTMALDERSDSNPQVSVARAAALYKGQARKRCQRN